MSHLSDPAGEAAVTVLAPRLGESVARETIAALRDLGWRPPLPTGTASRRRPAPPNAEYLAAKAARFGPGRSADGARS